MSSDEGPRGNRERTARAATLAYVFLRPCVLLLNVALLSVGLCATASTLYTTGSIHPSVVITTLFVGTINILVTAWPADDADEENVVDHQLRYDVPVVVGQPIRRGAPRRDRVETAGDACAVAGTESVSLPVIASIMRTIVSAGYTCAENPRIYFEENMPIDTVRGLAGEVAGMYRRHPDDVIVVRIKHGTAIVARAVGYAWEKDEQERPSVLLIAGL